MKIVTIDELARTTKEGFDAVSDEFAWVRSTLKDHSAILKDHSAILKELQTITKDIQRTLNRMAMSVVVQEHQNAIFDTRLKRLEVST